MNERKQSISRRKFLAWAGMGAASAALAACATPTPQVIEKVVTKEVEKEVKVEVEKTVVVEKEVEVEVTAPPKAQTVRVLFNNWGDIFNGLIQGFGDSYMDENPGITVEWDFNPDWRQKILTSLAAGDAPDVCYTNYSAQAALAFQGAFLPLDAYMVITGLKRKDFILSMYDQSLLNGKLYCLPGGADFIALYYNKDVFVEAGLDPEKPPVTAAELLEQSAAINQVDSNGAIQRLGYAPTSWDLKTWAYLFGGSWYDAQAQKVTADHPQIIEALEWMKAYADTMDVNQMEAFNSSLPDFWSPGNSFASKKTAFRLDGYWTYDPLDQYAPDIDYGVCFWPTLEGTPEERANYVIEGWMMAIPSGAKNPDGAWGFLKYGFVDNAWRMGCESLNGNCVIDQMDEFDRCVIDKLGPDNRMSPYFTVFSQTGIAGTRYWPAIPVNALYWDEVARAYDFVVRGEKTAAEALGEVTATVQNELDKALQGA